MKVFSFNYKFDMDSFLNECNVIEYGAEVNTDTLAVTCEYEPPESVVATAERYGALVDDV
jgi:hypothetical protein